MNYKAYLYWITFTEQINGPIFLQASPPPDWAAPGGVKLGEPAGRVHQMEEPEKEVNVPARDQVKLRGAKPKPADEIVGIGDHVRIEEERARLADVKQAPPIEPEVFVPHADQIHLKEKYKPKKVEPLEPGQVESGPLKETPAVVKQ